MSKVTDHFLGHSQNKDIDIDVLGINRPISEFVDWFKDKGLNVGSYGHCVHAEGDLYHAESRGYKYRFHVAPESEMRRNKGFWLKEDFPECLFRYRLYVSYENHYPDKLYLLAEKQTISRAHFNGDVDVSNRRVWFRCVHEGMCVFSGSCPHSGDTLNETFYVKRTYSSDEISVRKYQDMMLWAKDIEPERIYHVRDSEVVMIEDIIDDFSIGMANIAHLCTKGDSL